MRAGLLSLFFGALALLGAAAEFPSAPPDTGVSGVYEVMVGTDDADAAVKYFELYGFRVIADVQVPASKAERIYGVRSALRSVRMQNADVDAHGLLRILQWEQLLPGVGYARPDTPGQRMVAIRTADLFRIVDVYRDLRAAGEQWLPTDPVLDVIYQDETVKPDLFNRRVGVRESAIWGAWFNHVFFQRYGYDLPGYGYINEESVFRTSEATHHSFILDQPLAGAVDYYVSALGFRPEQSEPELNGDWQKGAGAVFVMPPGHSHQYIGMVSPNNISGKLKFFYPEDHRALSRMERVAINARGINMHSLYVRDLAQVKGLLRKQGIRARATVENEFGERSFVFSGPDGANWQILKLKRPPATPPVTEFKLKSVNH